MAAPATMAAPLPPPRVPDTPPPTVRSDAEAQAIVVERQRREHATELGARAVAKHAVTVLACPVCDRGPPPVWPAGVPHAEYWPTDGLRFTASVARAAPVCECAAGLIPRVHEATAAERMHDFIHRPGDTATCRACGAGVAIGHLCVVAACDQCGARMPADECSATARRVGAGLDRALHRMLRPAAKRRRGARKVGANKDKL